MEWVRLTDRTALLAAILCFVFLGMLSSPWASLQAQVVSPLQGGHYSPVVKNVRDMANPPPGLFFLWYNVYFSSDKYIDKDGNEFSSIRLDQIHQALPNIDVSLDLKGFTSIPALFWVSPFTILGGANYMAGISPSFISADASIITERGGIVTDTTITRRVDGKNSGFSDLFVAPIGLSWGWTRLDATFLYGFYAPTGKYEVGSSEALGLGFWTHQFQGYGYFYPLPDKSTAIMLALTYEANGKIEDTDVDPGDRLSLEWGIDQFLSEQFQVGVQGGHNWQVRDDTGGDVYWDATVHDRKSTVAFSAAYWPWKQRLQLNLKYGFDFAVRQRFKQDTWLLNFVFIPNVLTGK